MSARFYRSHRDLQSGGIVPADASSFMTFCHPPLHPPPHPPHPLGAADRNLSLSLALSSRCVCSRRFPPPRSSPPLSAGFKCRQLLPLPPPPPHPNQELMSTFPAGSGEDQPSLALRYLDCFGDGARLLFHHSFDVGA